jgi:pimeloyl-ACP methyl ester carboxylesterase
MAILHWGDESSTKRALLVHGLNASAATWWRVGEALAGDGWFVTAPDLLGHGSGERAETYTFADYAAGLPHGQWQLVVGHSLGGAIAVVATSRGLANAASLVLLDPVLEIAPQDWDEIRLDQLGELGVTAEEVAAAKPHWDARDVTLKAEAAGQADRAMVERTFGDNPGWSVVREAVGLAVPTLILGGDHSVYSMLSPHTVDAVSVNPQVDYRMIKGSGHSLHRDRPGETIAVLLEWLAAE